MGGWGKNLARNYYEMPDCRLKYLCDLDREKLDRLRLQLPGTTITTDFDAVLRDHDVHAVVIATTATSHYTLCKQALEHRKDVYVEKPLALEIGHAEELIEIAQRR
ncbi:MAG: Gfo/Idh/MocA family oxidoreductase, partial [Betaproteobacteria bacterium]